MLRATDRRAALVVAFVALLAFVAPNAVSGTGAASVLATSTTVTSASAVPPQSAATTPQGTLADALRPVGPQAARTHQVDRPAAGHAGVWAVASGLLVVAGLALLVAVRRSSWRVPPGAWRALAPARAPPVPHCC